MFISPIKAIEEGWVTHPQCKNVEDFKQRSFVSPNALDFDITQLYTIDSHAPFIINETRKQIRGGQLVTPSNYTAITLDYEVYWELEPHTTYDGTSDFHVTVPEGVAAIIIVRSTFNRNGIFITSGLWDSGYCGSVGMAIHNNSGVAYIAPGTRIGQLVFVESANAGKYLGGYNTAPGQHWNKI